jgi:predicted GNAT superfamily acetyltransferase
VSPWLGTTPPAQRIETPAYDPNGVVLAVDTGRWVGMATTSLHRDEDYAFSEMTGVLRSHRGQGIDFRTYRDSC